jgi:hypothetical protein
MKFIYVIRDTDISKVNNLLEEELGHIPSYERSPYDEGQMYMPSIYKVTYILGEEEELYLRLRWGNISNFGPYITFMMRKNSIYAYDKHKFIK